MKQSTLERQLSQKLSVSVIVGSVIWISLLLHGANVVHDSVLGTRFIVRLGPIVLNEITKVPVGDNFVVNLAFKPGLVLFCILWILIGITWAITATRLQEQN